MNFRVPIQEHIIEEELPLIMTFFGLRLMNKNKLLPKETNNSNKKKQNRFSLNRLIKIILQYKFSIRLLYVV